MENMNNKKSIIVNFISKTTVKGLYLTKVRHSKKCLAQNWKNMTKEVPQVTKDSSTYKVGITIIS